MMLNKLIITKAMNDFQDQVVEKIDHGTPLFGFNVIMVRPQDLCKQKCSWCEPLLRSIGSRTGFYNPIYEK